MNISELRLQNANARTLLQNWFEERETRPLDPDPSNLPEGVHTTMQIIKDGHKGIVTTEFDAGFANDSTYTAHYVEPPQSEFRGMGDRSTAQEHFFYEKAAKEVDHQIDADKSDEQPQGSYLSETKAKFSKEFEPVKQEPTASHNWVRDQPVTFWTDHKETIYRSQEKTGDTPFRKNTAFSKPIGESFDQTKPYDFENYPKM